MDLPIILTTWDFGTIGNSVGWPILSSEGSSLDAVEAACVAVEKDPSVNSVGYGGLPDSRGNVTLDGCVMLAPDKCGGVCAIKRHMHPVSIARRVMERTKHFLMAGNGADEFADLCGFPAADLLSPESKEAYEKWKKEHPESTGDKSGNTGGNPESGGDDIGGYIPPTSKGNHDTVGVLAIDSAGVMAGACSTSGLAFKLPGRVGDSPIIGHGIYVDPKAGAAVATGNGELMMSTCACFLAVEFMRNGMSPVQAGEAVLRRIVESHQLSKEGNEQAAFILLRPDGKFATVALRPDYKTAVRSGTQDVVLGPDFILFPENSRK